MPGPWENYSSSETPKDSGGDKPWEKYSDTKTEEKPQRGIFDKLFGLTGDRFQTWPERMVREAVDAPRAAMEGEYGTPGTREFSEKAFPGAQAMAGVAALGAPPGVDKAVSGIISSIGENLARTKSEKLNLQAAETVMKRAKQDEKSGSGPLDKAIQEVTESNAKGKPLALVDVLGENVRGLGGNVARQPGESRNIAKNFLTDRDKQARARIEEDIKEYVHGGDSMHETAQRLLDDRSKNSRAGYTALETMPIPKDERISQFLNHPLVKQGLEKGEELERLHATADNRPMYEASKLSAPTYRTADIAKQGLDAMIAEERNDLTGKLSARGVALDRFKRAFVERLDELDPKSVYSEARDQWAGPSASLDAIRVGRSLFKNSPEENASLMKGMSESNREFVRVGLADDLRQRLAKAGLSGDEAKAIIKNEWVKEQMKSAFKSEKDFDKFVEAVTKESQMFETKYDILGNSKTAARVAEDAGGVENLAGKARIVGKLMTGDLLSAAKDSWRMYRDLGIKPNPEFNEAIAKILFASPILDKNTMQLLSGNRPKPSSPNRLQGAANVAGNSGPAFAPAITGEAPEAQ